MKKVYIVFVMWFLLLVVVNKISPLVIQNSTDYELYYDYSMPLRATFLPWINFDGRHFLDIAVHGSYEPVHMVINGEPSILPDVRRVFFPAFPMLVHIFSGFGAINPLFIGLILNVLLIVTNIYLLYKIVSDLYDQSIAQKSILLLLAFPTSFYFLAFYSESLYLFASLLTFYFLQNGKKTSTAISTALATLTRLIGITLLPVLAYDAWKEWKIFRKKSWMYLIAPLGSLIYMLFSWVDAGSPLAFFASAQGSAFQRDPSFLSPYFVLQDMIFHILTPGRHSGEMFRYLMEWLEFGSLALVVGILIRGRKTLFKPYFVYMLSYVVLLLFSGSASSMHRYILVLFPIFPYLAQRLSGMKYSAWLTISTLLLILLSGLFLRGYWVA